MPNPKLVPTDKEIELRRYDERAKLALDQGAQKVLSADGARSVSLPLRAPYIIYEHHIQRHAKPGVRFLDLCGGTGLHSLTAAAAGADVTITDIAPYNLDLAKLRAASAGLEINTVVADADQLPFPENSFDVITCAGSLSYVDHILLLTQVQRILVPGGAFIFVDSFNHNPVYRLNRYIGYLRGRRSRSTLARMPSMQLIAACRSVFPDLVISHHGVFSFLSPALSLFASKLAVARFLDAVDAAAPPWLRKMAFKIVGVGHLPLSPIAPTKHSSLVS